MRALYREEAEFYNSKGCTVVPIKEVDALIENFNKFTSTYHYQNYYLKHLICTDAEVRSAYEDLLAEGERICSQGANPVSQYILGHIYEYKVDKSYQKKAFDLYKSGADAGFARSMISLGNMYEFGKACVKNERAAFELYSKADSTGYIHARAELGRMYFTGKHVQKSFRKAFDMFKDSFAGGENEVAVNGLGLCLMDAEKFGFKKDINEATRLFKMIADRNSMALRKLGFIAMWEEKSVHSAISWYEKAAGMGDIMSTERLSEIYSGDLKLTKDFESHKLKRYWKDRHDELKLIERNIDQSATESDYSAKAAEMEEKKKEMSKPASCLAVFFYGIIGILIILFGISIFGDILSFILSLPIRLFNAIFT